jgi:hypothetical protein
MSNTTTQHAGLALRASDAEREHTVTLLRHGFTDGRLSQDELVERAAAAYAARTTAELSDLTIDLPRQDQQPRPGRGLDRRMLCILMCLHPPVALVYWLLHLCRSTGTRDPEPTTPAVTQAGAAEVHDLDELAEEPGDSLR